MASGLPENKQNGHYLGGGGHFKKLIYKNEIAFILSRSDIRIRIKCLSW